MNINEYNRLRNEIAEKDKALKLEFLRGINTVSVGDVVIDHFHAIRVEKVRLHYTPLCEYKAGTISYSGDELTLNGVPKKRPVTRRVYLKSIKVVIPASVKITNQIRKAKKEFWP
jgi:hypothetical protein